MHTYTLPPMKGNKEEEDTPMIDGGGTYPDSWDRRVNIPIDRALLDELDVGGDVEIILNGRIIQLSDQQQEEGNNRTSLELEITQVKSGGMDDELFEAGFNRKRKSHRANY